MKNLNLVLLLLISFFPVWLFAKQVGPETALQVAETQANSSNLLRNAQELKLVFTKTLESKKVNSMVQASSALPTILYYIFNVGEKGFVIVSGDDIAVPVLGYSDAGIYDPENLPPNFVYYLDDFLAKEIEQAIKQDVPQSEKIKTQWETCLSGEAATLRATTAVLPLLGQDNQSGSIAWNQYAPYNNLCPVDPQNNNNSLTGCVATAMAQIMRYYEYPKFGNGNIGGYTTQTRKISIPQIDISTFQYDWGNMIPNYSATLSSQAQKDAVANLMYHCGISVQMDYTYSEGSAAPIKSAALALRDNFRYSQSIDYKVRSYFSNVEWDALIKMEIDNNRPVLYGGQDPDNGGHAFVCDGYDNFGNFHFNWGWGGSVNGYFPTTALNPQNYVFNDDQEIITNIIPDSGGEKSYEINILSGTDISTSRTTLDRGESFLVDASFVNTGLYDFTGNVGIAIVDASDNIMNVISQYSISLNQGYYYADYKFMCTIPQTAIPGSCRIRVVYKSADSSEWTIVKGSLGYADVLTLTISDNPPRTHGISIMDGLKSSATAVDKGQSFTVSAQFINIGEDSMTGDYGAALVDGSDKILEVTGTYNVSTSLPSGYNWMAPFTIPCVVSSTAPGNYKIRAIFKPTGKSWSIVYGVTSDIIDICDLTVNVPTGMQETAIGKVNVYEANGFIHVVSGASGPINEITVYSLQGALICKESSINATSYTLDRSLPSGVYIVKVTSEGKIDNVKVVVR